MLEIESIGQTLNGGEKWFSDKVIPSSTEIDLIAKYFLIRSRSSSTPGILFELIIRYFSKKEQIQFPVQEHIVFRWKALKM